MALATFDFSHWIDRHAHLLKPPVGKLVRDMQGLGDAARAKLLAGNARRFLGLP